MNSRAHQNIALIGFMGSGKSSVGRLLAKKLRFHFVDTDRMVVERAGRQITEIFNEQGEPFFREQERLALESLRGQRRLVVATGGGIVMQPENVALLRELAFVVWLSASEEIIFERVSRNDRRPLLHTPNPRKTIAALLAQRRPLYESAAHFCVETSRRPHAEVAGAILREFRDMSAES